ncbi:hypothetical protein NEFER02_1969 [Nematocida sp. LUAm2]|nr:hypothetical protein NEFER02_1969 [Nematocida sp. LUAm2]
MVLATAEKGTSDSVCYKDTMFSENKEKEEQGNTLMGILKKAYKNTIGLYNSTNTLIDAPSNPNKQAEQQMRQSKHRAKNQPSKQPQTGTSSGENAPTGKQQVQPTSNLANGKEKQSNTPTRTPEEEEKFKRRVHHMLKENRRNKAWNKRQEEKKASKLGRQWNKFIGNPEQENKNEEGKRALNDQNGLATKPAANTAPAIGQESPNGAAPTGDTAHASGTPQPNGSKQAPEENAIETQTPDNTNQTQENGKNPAIADQEMPSNTNTDRQETDGCNCYNNNNPNRNAGCGCCHPSYNNQPYDQQSSDNQWYYPSYNNQSYNQQPNQWYYTSYNNRSYNGQPNGNQYYHPSYNSQWYSY